VAAGSAGTRSKTIADFRKDNVMALRTVCARFVELCRKMAVLATASVAIDGSKFKAVSNREELAGKGGTAAEMALSVLAYNLTRVMNIVGTKPLMAAIVA